MDLNIKQRFDNNLMILCIRVRGSLSGKIHAACLSAILLLLACSHPLVSFLPESLSKFKACSLNAESRFRKVHAKCVCVCYGVLYIYIYTHIHIYNSLERDRDEAVRTAARQPEPAHDRVWAHSNSCFLILLPREKE